MTEIKEVKNNLENITSQIDNGELASSDKRKLSIYLEEQEYLLNQYKNHLNSENNLNKTSLENIDDKINNIEHVELEIKNIKESLYSYKDKLV